MTETCLACVEKDWLDRIFKAEEKYRAAETPDDIDKTCRAVHDTICRVMAEARALYERRPR